MLFQRMAVGFAIFALLNAVACKAPTSPMIGAQQQKASSSGGGNGDGLGTSQDGKSTQAQEPQQTTPPVTTVPDTSAQQTTTPSTTTNPDKYAGYQNPSTLALQDPTAIKLYNYLKEGIVSINGQMLAQMVPPGKAMVYPKLYDDLVDDDTYRITIQTESGIVVRQQFESANVDQDAWRASVKIDESTKQIVIKENAGGGTGGGGGLTNFR